MLVKLGQTWSNVLKTRIIWYGSLQNTLCMVVPVPLVLALVPIGFCMVVPVPLVLVLVPIGFCMVVPVPPCFGTGTTSWFCLEMLLFSLFGTIFLHKLLYSIILKKSTWNLTQNNSTILELVIWNFLLPTLGKNSKNSTKGPSIPTKPNKYDGFHVYYIPTRVFPTKLQEF